VPRPELAGLWGLARSFAREHPPVRLTLVDVDELPPAAALPCGGEGLWALRGGQALAPRLERVRVEGARRAPASDGAVLVTGGLGALGLRVAEHLVQAGGPPGKPVPLGDGAQPLLAAPDEHRLRVQLRSSGTVAERYAA